MSYEHCERHDCEATNGCDRCASEAREEPFRGAPRPWHVGLFDPLLLVDSSNAIVGHVRSPELAELIVKLVNRGHSG